MKLLQCAGCLSAQRIVADLIPRYACHCPPALEAAAKVVINMHNWSLTLINRREDTDGIAFETARACIFGLADVCCTASSVAPKSAVIRGICSAVFQNVLTFFISLLEGKDALQVVDKSFLNMQDSPAVFSELKQKVLDEDESSLTKLSKFCVLCLLWIFFSCPRDLLAACLELLGSATKEGAPDQGQRFLSLVTSNVDDDEAVHPLDRANGGPRSGAGSTGSGIRGNEVDEEIMTDVNQVSDSGSSVPNSCLLMLVILHNSYHHVWILCNAISSIYLYFCDARCLLYLVVFALRLYVLCVYWELILENKFCSFLLYMDSLPWKNCIYTVTYS